MNLAASLGLASARVIALCGAGGKSSLMFALGEAFAAAGEEVLVCTTTKMSLEQVSGRWQAAAARDAGAVCALPRAAGQPVLAYHHADPSRGKVIGFAAETIDRVAASGRFARILVEADGSAGRPLKAPAEHEPVFPAVTDTVIMVAGAGGLGRPLDDETVFRAALWSQRTGIALGEPVTAASLARMVVHPQGLARGAPAGTRRVLFINQCDDPARIAAARLAVAKLREQAGELPTCAVLGRLQPGPQVLHRACLERDDSHPAGGADARTVA